MIIIPGIFFKKKKIIKIKKKNNTIAQLRGCVVSCGGSKIESTVKPGYNEAPGTGDFASV